ncbi:MAG: 23S rRNA (pseudouridine(1915)-N(3))-methyltransferase RlmH, partial [Coriobacteriales bacterium]|nr:23S rRNA (pseudouridine(1915)-N(3))-methyltransferase RlmH [Coriobacteriales bacterium]
DIEGTEFSSLELATHFKSIVSAGNSHLCFIVGSSCGVAATIKKAVKEKISFGKITLAHNLALVVLLEQIYRAFCIINNHPYHK